MHIGFWDSFGSKRRSGARLTPSALTPALAPGLASALALTMASALAMLLAAPAHAQDQPNLFFDQNDHARIEARSHALPWLEEARSAILTKADAYLATPVAPYPLVSKDNSLGTAGRALQNRLGTLGFASYLTGDMRYARKGREILLAVVRQTQPDNHSHWQTHLQQGDAAQALVLGYDWLYPVLSEPERAEVRAELEQFGTVLFDSDTPWGADAPGVTSGNHNSVHFGGLGLVALALGDRPEWLAKATERMRGFFTHYADATGYATEGHHYVGYGLGGAVPFSMALARKGGPDLLAEADAKGLALIGDQMVWKLLPFEGRMLALNDNFERPGELPALVGTLRAGRGDQLWAYLESLKQSGKMSELGGYFGISYVAPFVFLWGDTPVAPVAPDQAGLALGHRFESGRVFLRSSWQGEDAAHGSMTSGYDMHRGHDQQDENSVTFYAKGEGFLIDPQYWLETSDTHNTLTIEGVEQIKGGDGRIVAYREDARGAMVRGQAEEAYDFNKALIGVADRKMYFVRSPRPYMLFRDDMRTEDDRAQTFVSRYITYPGNRIEQAGDAVILHGERRGGKALLAAFSGMQQVTLREDDVSQLAIARRGSRFDYKTYLRRISTRFSDISPELISLVVPFDGDTPPMITITPATEQRYSFVVKVRFADGAGDEFLVTPHDIALR